MAKPSGLHHFPTSENLLDASTIFQLPATPHPYDDVQALRQHAPNKFGALEATVGVQARRALCFQEGCWHGPQQLQGQLGGGRGPLPPPDLEGPGQPQRSTAQVQHHEMYAVHPVVGVYPVGQRGELAGLLETGQVHQ